MAVIEKDGLYQYIDEYGNIYILYPVTKLDNVSGTGKLVHLKDGTTLQTLDGANIALITADDLKNFATKDEANATDRVKYESGVLKTLGGTEIVTGNARIATGSYVGTGVYGANNPTSITFEFEPKLVFVHGLEDYQTGFINASACTTNFVKGTFRNFGKTNVQYAKKSNDGKTIYFYDTGDQWLQHNGANITYYFIAIG